MYNVLILCISRYIHLDYVLMNKGSGYYHWIILAPLLPDYGRMQSPVPSKIMMRLLTFYLKYIHIVTVAVIICVLV